MKAKDTELIEHAQQEGRIIITRDKDFLALTQFPRFRAPIIVIRLKDQKPATMRRYIIELLQNQKEEILGSSLTIVTEDSADSYPYGQEMIE